MLQVSHILLLRLNQLLDNVPKVGRKKTFMRGSNTWHTTFHGATGGSYNDYKGASKYKLNTKEAKLGKPHFVAPLEAVTVRGETTTYVRPLQLP